jgi:nondiscriminating aspartyl-tRNA synthetase
MERTLVKNLPSLTGSEVKVQGFVATIRDQKRMAFLLIRDHTGTVQAVHDKKEGDQAITAKLASLTEESAVTITGTVIPSPQVKLGQLEVQLKTLDIVGAAASPLPIAADSVLDKQLDWRFLSLRRPENLLVFKVQTTLEHAMREFWAEHGFLEIHSPKLMGAASESGAELFQLEYFGQTASLAQSPQFYKQMAMAAGFDRIFEIGPVFRANPSFTSRHDTEFTSVDMEFSWIDSHEDVMVMEETWLTHVIRRVAEAHGEEIERTFGLKLTVPTLPFPRISLKSAGTILSKRGHQIPPGTDLDPEGERQLAAYVKEKHGHEFVFVTDYPIEVRPFYHMRHEKNRKLTKSFDLLWRGLEVTTGAQREHRPDVLERQAVEKGHDLTPLKDYIAFFRYGCPPHGGMGVGLTRLLMIMLGRSNVREVTYLYRGPNRLTP